MENISVNTTIAVPSSATFASSTAPTHKVEPMQRMDTTHSEERAKSENVNLEGLTSRLNKIADDSHIDISFEFNDKLNKIVINMLDKNTGEVIRKLPTEDAIKFAEGMLELDGKFMDMKG